MLLLSLFLIFFMFMVGSLLSLMMSEIEFLEMILMNTNLASGFLFLVLVVSITMMLYTSYYMVEEFSLGFYIIMMFIFMLSMLGLLSAGNWTIMLISWEGLGISSFFLINYYQTWESYNNACHTVMTMRVGEYFLILFLSSLFFSYYLDVRSIFCNQVSLLFFVLFCMTKSAQFPFTAWLPKAMSAPTPTSALVHSSTLVTAGLLMLMTYSSVIMNYFTMSLMLYIGLLTMVLGSFLCLMEFSVKKMVAYSTLSQMGLAMMVLGMGNFSVSYYMLLSHGFAKSLLFMQVGYLIHLSSGQQNWRNWESIGTNQGYLRIQVGCTLFSLCGVMFTGGMISKEMIMDMLSSKSWYLLVLFFQVLSIYLTFFYSILIYKTLFISSLSPILLNSSSVVMMIGTVLEFMLVHIHFCWMLMNSVSESTSFVYLEILVPLPMLFTLLISIKFLFNMSFVFVYLNNLMLCLSGISFLSWINKFVYPINYMESFIYSLNINIPLYVWILMMRFSNINYLHIMLFFLVFLMLMF